MSLDIKEALSEGAPLVRIDATSTFFPKDEAVAGTGELPVPGGDRIIVPLNAVTPAFNGHVIDLQDAHPEKAAYLASTYLHLGKKPYSPTLHPSEYTVTAAEFRAWRARGEEFPFDADKFERYLETVGAETLWADHAMIGQPGAELHPGIVHRIPEKRILKGTGRELHPYGSTDRAGMEDAGLKSELRRRRSRVVFTAGLAEDFCVGDNNLQLADDGFQVVMISDATAAIDAPLGDGRTTLSVAREAFARAGILSITSSDFLAQVASRS